MILVCRDANKGRATLEFIKKAADSENIDLLLADLSSQTEIRNLAKIIHERYKKIDILINNAGLVLAKKTLSKDGIEMTLATNYLAPFLLTNLLFGLLTTQPSRVINISSAIHQWAKLDLEDLQYERRKYGLMKAYAQSKLLLTAMSFEAARQWKNTPITVNSAHPGAVKTQLGTNNANKGLLKYLDRAIKFFFISPARAAQPIIDLATNPEMENISGEYFVKGKVKAASKAARDPDLARKIWVLSKKLCNLG